MLSQRVNLAQFFFYLLIIFLPTQLGYHFWPKFSYVYGIRIDYLSPTLYLTDIFILCILLLYFTKFIALIRKNKNKFIFVSSFLIILIISTILSINKPSAVYGIFKFLEFLLLGVFIANEIRIDRKILYLFSFSIIYESIISIAQFLNQASLNGILYFLGERTFNGQTPGIANASLNGELILRSYGTFSHPNVLAGFLVIVMIFLLSFFLKEKGVLKKVIFIALLLGTVSLFTTLSRTALFLWIFLAPLIMFVKNKINKKTILIFFSIYLVFTYVFFNTNLLLRFTQINLTDEAFTKRQIFLRQGYELFLKHPFFGVGLNNFIPNTPYLDKPIEAGSLQPIHNIFVLRLVETGVFGFSLLLIFLYYTAKRIRKNNLLIFSVFSVFFLGLFDHYFITLQQGQILLAIVLGLSWAKKVD